MITQYSRDMERVARALHLCRNLHEGQVDKCGQPYWIHPFTVGMRGLRNNDLSHIIVGLLHDIPEDTGISVESLATLMELTEEEIKALNLLTRNKSMSYDEYIDSIIKSNNPIAISVKLSDLVHNSDLDRFRDAQIPITPADEKRAEKYKKSYMRIYDSIFKEEP